MKKIGVFLVLLFVILWNVFGTPLMESITPEEPPKIEEPIKQDLYVFVTGAVRKPGLYAFPTAVTVGDAIHAAGDALPYAAAEAVNYADKIDDGMQVHIPYNLDGIPATGEADGKININEADEKKLTELPGIGPAMAKTIIEYRDEHGAFSSEEELQEVKGIGSAKYDKVKDSICV
ncbi:MAG: helix-hairpin-helix domain-containing protein [Caecibacter sp.]|nr:helix-hairpin-helix domain-containing protein [Caecibacter sp.]